MYILNSIILSPKIRAFLFSAIFISLSSLFSHGSLAEALCIKDNKANLRQGPGKHYEKLWTVFKYMPFKQLGKKGNWLKVQDLEGDKFWVYKKITTKKYMCAVIKNNATKLRQGPGTSFPEVKWSPQSKFFSMKVLKIKKPWVHVEDIEGDRAWVYRPLVWVQ